MKFILGKKLPMTQVWENDKVLALTPILAGPCTVSQVKNQKTDKYSALQLTFGARKEKNIKKPQLGHFKKAGVTPMHVREFRTENEVEAKIGDKISVATFAVGDVIAVTGTSKGCGFQGVVKRHGFKGGRKSHGNKDQLRMPGSVGAKGPAHIFKGMKMGGRMGNEKVTIKNLSIVSIDLEKNILYVKGAVPGANNGLLMIKGQGDLIVDTAPKVEETVVSPVVEEKVDEITVETPEAEVKEAKEEKVKEDKTEKVKESVEATKVEAEEVKPVEAEAPVAHENKEEAPAA